MKCIRELRERAGLTQAQLAHRIGVAPSTIYNYERWSTEPRASHLRDLGAVFNVPINRIKLRPHDRLVEAYGHGFVLTAQWFRERGVAEARIIEHDWSEFRKAGVLPAGLIPGTGPPTNNPTAISADQWSTTGATEDEALDALERLIRDGLEAAFPAGTVPDEPVIT